MSLKMQIKASQVLDGRGIQQVDQLDSFRGCKSDFGAVPCWEPPLQQQLITHTLR